MKLFLNKKHRNRSIIGTLIMIPLFMKFMPYGSFDPQELGFWWSIITALIITGGINLFLVKFHH